MKKVIAFSLWGNNPKYTIGALRNAELSPTIYPGWICRFYIGKDVPWDIVTELSRHKHVEIFIMSDPADWTGSVWRFYSAADDTVDIMISRDTDSRLNHREKAAVDEWLLSDKDFHIMRDHPHHREVILAGMWGCRNRIMRGIVKSINQFRLTDNYDIDQDFLRKSIFPAIKDHTKVHDDFFEKTGFPTERKDFEYVGEIYDEFENRAPIERNIIKNFILHR